MRRRDPRLSEFGTGEGKIPPFYGIGRQSLLSKQAVGLICSVQCPGSVVLKTFDAIRELRDAGIGVAGGFHSPMERECLDFLLRGEQPVVICPARGLARFPLPTAWREAIESGRMLLLSPFVKSIPRTTTAQAETRNAFVSALARAVLVPHASPGGKAEALARRILSAARPLFTFNDETNSRLLDLGALAYSLDNVQHALAGASPGM